MKREKINIFYIIISIISLLTYLYFAGGVQAVNMAGSSAQLLVESKMSEADRAEFIYQRKKLAIKIILERYNSPMIGEEDTFIQTCRKYSLDCYLLPSIAGLESTFGRFIWPGSFNPFGWGRGYIMFSSWKEGIDKVGKGLRENYIDKNGLTTVDGIGIIYSESPTWAQRVNYFIDLMRKEEEKLSLISANFPVEL